MTGGRFAAGQLSVLRVDSVGALAYSFDIGVRSWAVQVAQGRMKREHGAMPVLSGLNATAARATVSGELFFGTPLTDDLSGRWRTVMTREPGDLPIDVVLMLPTGRPEMMR